MRWVGPLPTSICNLLTTGCLGKSTLRKKREFICFLHLFDAYTERRVKIHMSASNCRAQAIKFYLLNLVRVKKGHQAGSVNTLILTRSVLYVILVD